MNKYIRLPYPNELYHHGIKGQKWGVRRFQNQDGTLTAAGRKRYSSKKSSDNNAGSTVKKAIKIGSRTVSVETNLSGLEADRAILTLKKNSDNMYIQIKKNTSNIDVGTGEPPRLKRPNNFTIMKSTNGTVHGECECDAYDPSDNSVYGFVVAEFNPHTGKIIRTRFDD